MGYPPIIKFAPDFDNGSSLGYEIAQGKIEDFLVPAKLASYIEQGRHHCGWSANDDARGSHFDLCRRFRVAFPEVGEAMRSVIRFEKAPLSRTLDRCGSIGGPLALTPERERLIYELVCARRQRLAEVLEV